MFWKPVYFKNRQNLQERTKYQIATSLPDGRLYKFIYYKKFQQVHEKEECAWNMKTGEGRNMKEDEDCTGTDYNDSSDTSHENNALDYEEEPIPVPSTLTENNSR